MNEADEQLILAPEVTRIRITYDQTYAVLSSLFMLHSILQERETAGLAPWLYTTAGQLTSRQQYRHILIFDGLSKIFYYNDIDYRSFPDYIEGLARRNARDIRQHILEALIQEARRQQSRRQQPADLPTLEGVLATQGEFETLMHSLFYGLLVEEPDYLNDLYNLLQRPEKLRQFIVDHLNDLWTEFIRGEWHQHENRLLETVNAFQQINFNGLSVIEAGRLITGRDLNTSAFQRIVERHDDLHFIPAPHLGPYIYLNKGQRIARVVFQPRLPATMGVTVPVLEHSDLLGRMNALADDTRLRILELLKHHEELSATGIMQYLSLSQSAASRHLRQLTAAGFVSERRCEGAAKCYTLNYEQIQRTTRALENFLDPN